MTDSQQEVIAAHRQQDRQWQALLDSAGEGIWGVDLDGSCSFVNRLALEIFGFSGEEMLGNNMHALVHHHHADGSEYADADCPVYGVFRNSGPIRQRTDTMFRKDGSSFMAEMSAEPVTVNDRVVGAVVTFRDVSEQQRQQQELRRAYDVAEQRKAELDAVIESIPHGIFIATRDGKVRTNQRARDMTGESFPVELNTLNKALSGKPAVETIHAANAWIRSVAAPVLLNGQILGGVAVNTDITQIRKQEEVLRKSEKLAAVGQLASSIAHEINNPLESLTNLLYLIRNSASLNEVHEYVSIAETELARVTEITLQTLRFHRMQNKPVEVNVGELLDAVISLYIGRSLVREVKIERRMRATPPICCLEGEIRQVFNNLVRNAIDAMASGDRLCIRLRSGCNKNREEGVRITIGDTGEGISPFIMSHLFEPFHTTKEITGTGLGLWVSKGIIDKHGGTISVRTRRTAPSGTVFSVWLSLDAKASLEEDEARSSPAHDA